MAIKEPFAYKHSGQALVYVIAMLLAMSLCVSYVYNANTLSTEKMKLQNATDAVAYSVATIEARDLNFKAYTNRAMIANQIAIAQAVGVTSWIRFLDRSTDNFAKVTSWIPYLNAVTNTLARVVNAVKQGTEVAMEALALVGDTMNTVLTAAQSAMHLATTAIAVDVAAAVAQANDKDIDTGLALGTSSLAAQYVNEHFGFTKQFDPDRVRNRSNGYQSDKARMDNFRSLTLESRDGFSKNRSYGFADLPALVLEIEMRRAGSTDLNGQNTNAPYGSWMAMDTLSVHERNRGCGFLGTSWCSWDEVLPVGWGAAKNARSNERPRFTSYRGSGDFGGSWRSNPIASSFANRQDGNKVMSASFGGLRAFYDLQLDGLLTKAPGIQILLTKPSSKVRTARRLGLNSGRANLESGGNALANQLSSMSSATPYFARVNDRSSDTSQYTRADQMREYGNLYNPYWQARLDPISTADRLKIQALASFK